ncbi:MAG TPA: glycosyltransferase, partial [Bdellovibrionota bacterium]|nr:glycosyltransferase [Bdellovibrionota bacterium]
AEILEVTLAAALAVDYPKKRVYVLDDGHRPEVKRLTEELGAAYILGPKIHAKAGNLNNALSKSSGDLVVVFDTDHIPVRTFLKETVPPFEDSKVGCVQTPHHFRNADIFQRAYRLNRRLSNEQDMFNHAIQSGRDSWGGAFFVGSGAVFRRKAVEQLGGFLLMSITEDIHTSQHLHARGWRSVFVDKDLAVGLAAENLVSYLVQRRRWMLGCLQIFFKDNPLLSRTLPWRHRLGYFASLYYFFFPLARMVFWLTPLYFLLFHLHPIISDVSLLLAYLLPFMIFLPMLSSSLLPGWPRTGWGVLYETMVAAPLFRSMFDLLLPRSLAFKVTPKGVVAEKRRFDSASALLTSGMAILTLAAIAKGFAEFYYFGIEKDAYFFNLGWAIYNLVFLAAALQVAWERPQLRTEERVRRSFPAVLSCEGKDLPVRIENMSISGCSMILAAPSVIPARPTLQFRLSKESFELPGKLIYNERVARRKWSVGVAFEALFTNDRRRFALALLAAPESWDHVHEGHIRRRFWMGLLFATSLARYFSPLRYRRRQFPRERGIRFFRFVDGGVGRTVVQRELSGRGFSFLTSRPLPLAKPCPILEGSDPEKWARPLYCVRRFPGIWRVGMEFCPQPAEEMPWQSYLAA